MPGDLLLLQKIKIEGFKSLRKVDLKLGAFNLFIGTNSSGKSNFLDALRVLQGIGFGFTFDEVLNGKPRSATTEVWAGIRGGSAKAEFASAVSAEPGIEPLISFGLSIGDPLVFDDQIVYEIAFSARKGAVRREHLKVLWDGDVYDSTAVPNHPESPVFQVRYYQGYPGRQPHLGFEKSRPVLHQISNRVAFNAKTEAEQLKRTLVNMQRLEPVPSVLREYSTPQQVRRMGEHGENFAALVKSILDDEKAKSNYLSWLKQLTPNEVDEVKILKGALGEPLFALVERGQEYPAPVLSDGTLRFAAIAAAFFQPDMPEMITIEEIENGIHPNRLRLLVELLKSQTIGTGRQVVATTHSPVLLSWLKREDYDYTFYCKRSDQTGESIIRPLSQIPRFLELAEKQPVGELFAEGWPENAL
jgi:hypothetical protein